MEDEVDRGSEEIIEMFCELCKKRDRSRTADGFCVDCVRYYCAECLANHNEFLPDHVHQDKKNMPQDVCLQQCPGHAEEIIKFYCSSCNKFFCSLCKKKDHSKCKAVSHLPHLVNQLEKGKEFKEFKQELEGVFGEISNIESVIESEKESIELISGKALSKVESTRQQFIEWLDTRVEKIEGEIKTIKDKDKKAIEEDSSKLSVIRDKVFGMMGDVEQMQRERKRCQLFMTIKDAQNKPKGFFAELRQLKERTINRYEFEQPKKDDRSLDNLRQFGRLIFERSEDSTTKLEENRSSSLAENEGSNVTGRIMPIDMIQEVQDNNNRPTKFNEQAPKITSKSSKLGLVTARNVSQSKLSSMNVNENSDMSDMVVTVKNKCSRESNTLGKVESSKDFSGTATMGPKEEKEIPDVEVQKSSIQSQLMRPYIKGEVWYVLDVKWFKQWKSYVGYESWDYYNVGEQSNHPGPIDNTPIFQEGTEKLKEHMIADLDYALVPEEGWRELVSWYGMLVDQKPLPRRVIKEGVYTKSLEVEVYPWCLKLCKNSNQDYQIVKTISRSDTIEQLEQVMREEFNIAPEKEARLWNRYMTNMYEQLNKKDNTLQDEGLYQGQIIVIEQRNCDGTWPRDKLKTKQFQHH